MRWLLLFVLVLNMAYIAWQMDKSSDETQVRKPIHNKIHKEIPQLVLISEMKPQKLLIADNPEEESVKSAASDKPVIVAESAVKKEVVALPQPIKEEKVEVAAVKKVVVKPKPQKPSAQKPGDVCHTLGPFRDMSKLRRLIRDIKDHVIEVSFRRRDEQEQSMFWVYLSPEANAKAAHKLSQKLIAKKIKDYYIITTGVKVNGISLGHFKDKERAYGHADRLRKLGFKSEVDAVFRSYVIYWLDYKLKHGSQIPASVLEKHIVKDVNRLNRECS